MRTALLAAAAVTALVYPTSAPTPIAVAQVQGVAEQRLHPTAPAEHAAPTKTKPVAAPAPKAAPPTKAAKPVAKPPKPPVASDCVLADPWDSDLQADDDCNNVANVCEHLNHSERYEVVVARGYGVDGYCVPTQVGLLHPPFPQCQIGDDSQDDYNCDGQADYYR